MKDEMKVKFKELTDCTTVEVSEKWKKAAADKCNTESHQSDCDSQNQSSKNDKIVEKAVRGKTSLKLVTLKDYLLNLMKTDKYFRTQQFENLKNLVEEKN